jgi:hypothetical protein
MGKKLYACHTCGFVYCRDDLKIIKERIDTKGGGRHYPTRPFHGYYYYKQCPECKNIVGDIKTVPDKEE